MHVTKSPLITLCHSANGLHVNVSLWNASDATNAFKDPSDDALGYLRRHKLPGRSDDPREVIVRAALPHHQQLQEVVHMGSVRNP